MHHGKEKWTKHLDFFLIDIVVFNLSFFIAYRFQYGLELNAYFQDFWQAIVIVMSIFDALILLFCGLLEDVLQRGYLKELFSIIQQVVLLELLTSFYLYLMHIGGAYSRTVVLASGLIFTGLNFIVRSVWKRMLQRRLKRDVRRFAVVGEGPLVERFRSALAEERYTTNEIVAVIPAEMKALPRLEALLESNGADYVVIVQDDLEVFNGTVFLCEKYGCRVNVIPFYHDSLSARTTVEQIGDMKLLNFRRVPLDSLANAMVKRMFDIVSSAVLLVVTSPVMLVCAVGTKLSSPGPVLFRQERVGQNRKNFTMLKFRSMRLTGTENTGWSTDEDPRKTKFGSFMRKLSLDELPQLINVFRGEMSLVGPRPEVPFHVDHFKEEIPMYLVRQQVKPGITGWAQVNGLRGDTDIAERVKYDIWYIENWSLSLDVKIAFKTVFGGMINTEKVR